jgi:hypothetical protein
MISLDNAFSLSSDAAREENRRVRVELDRCTAEEWDRFAARCQASFRAASRAARAWQLDHHPFHHLRRYALWLERESERVRIGQYAIGFGPRRRVFADGIQLLPEYDSLWSGAMSAALAQTGPGVYHYGSRWSLEPPRESQCALISGVTIHQVQPITMYAVDFSRWPTWDAYLRQVSANARRNAKKAEKLQQQLHIGVRHGLHMLVYAPHLLRLRRGLYARKQVSFSTAANAARLLLRAAAMRKNAFIALASVHGKTISAFGGVVFGENTYFLDAGSLQEDNGVYWFLMLRMLQDAYARAPSGRFVTGAYYENSPVSPGLDFFRYQCRAQGHPTSEFVFRYGSE